jgi:hypothetical protein
MPIDDAAWHASLRRQPGTARRRLARLGRLALQHPADVFLRLRLPEQLGSEFLRTVEAARRNAWNHVEQIPWDQPWPSPTDSPPAASLLAARDFSVRCRRAPAWVGLLALLEGFVDTFDAPEACPKRHSDALYIRDGWRCSAPGCSSRRNLEDHHLLYRCRGGSDELGNRVCACGFHHRMGEHGGLARCRGVAPLGVVWTLGKGGIGGTYRNEIRLDRWGQSSPKAAGEPSSAVT